MNNNFTAYGTFLNPEHLYQVRLPIVDYDICEEAYLEVADFLDLTGTICAGSVESGGIGSCQVHNIIILFLIVTNIYYYYYHSK